MSNSKYDNRERVYFPQEFIDLQSELVHHKELCEKLARHHHSEFEIKMAQIATHLEIIMHGDYDAAAMINLAKIMTEKLKQKRDGKSILVIEN